LDLWIRELAEKMGDKFECVCVCVCVWERERERERENHIFTIVWHLKKETWEDLGILEGDEEEQQQQQVQLCCIVYVMCDHVNSMIIQFPNFHNCSTLLQIPGHFVFLEILEMVI
jgi:hypothetical protein